MARLHGPALREAYGAWLELRGAQPIVSAHDLGARMASHAADMFVATVTSGESGHLAFHVLTIGEGLTARLGRAFGDDAAHEEALGGAQETAYRRAALGGFPTYEYARFDLGEGTPTLFERLILPVSEDGRRVTHLLGIVHIGEPGVHDRDRERAALPQRKVGASSP